jgi:hypothetical protein
MVERCNFEKIFSATLKSSPVERVLLKTDEAITMQGEVFNLLISNQEEAKDQSDLEDMG